MKRFNKSRNILRIILFLNLREEEKNRQISFLDVLLTRTNKTINTSVFTKSTSTGDSINFNGLCPDKYKISVIKTLIHRAFEICSNWELFHIEVIKIKQRLVNHNFPIKVIDNVLNKFISCKTLRK